MRKLLVEPQRTPLRGTITVPGDKSISHRAVMLGSLAAGKNVIRRWLPAGDTLATLNCFQNMGVPIGTVQNSPQDWDLIIHGQGLYGLQPPAGPLDFVNAGTGIRLAAGLMVGQRFPVTLDGSAQLRARPMGRIVNPLHAMGAKISATEGKAPMHIEPAELVGTDYEMPVASAQVKSALLLAGLYARGRTRVHQPGPARDHTERMLTAMGVELIVTDDGWIGLAGSLDNLGLQPLDMTVPADISSAAFPLIAAAIVPHSEITITNVGLNETRTGIRELLARMGAVMTLRNEAVTGGEPAGDLTIQFDELHATTAEGAVVVRAIDEMPIFAVAATQAAGVTTVRDAAELRVKEVDRIGVLAAELRQMGVPVEEAPDGFTIHGPVRPHGGEVDSHDDHRLGMCLAIAGLVATGPTTVLDAGCVADSFPGFVETMQALGANMRWA